MTIKVLTTKSICKCPHNGKLDIISSHKAAKGSDGELVTFKDFSKALIQPGTCTLLPIAGGPCTCILMAKDPLGNKIKIQQDSVVTEKVIAITDKGYPIRIEDPGKSFITITVSPQSPALQKAAFMEAAASTAEKSSEEETQKKILSAYWNTAFARRGKTVKLQARVKGFENGAEAVFQIYEYDMDGNHDFIKEIKSKIDNNEAIAEWIFEYKKNVDAIPTHEESEKGYNPPEYFFELKIENQSARSSALLEFKDWIKIKLTDEEEQPVPDMEYIVHLPDGTQRKGKLDKKGYIRMKDIPPGKVRIELLFREEGE